MLQAYQWKKKDLNLLHLCFNNANVTGKLFNPKGMDFDSLQETKEHH